MTKETRSLYKFKNELGRQPEFFNPNCNQTIFICASPIDGLYIDVQNKTEYDIDEGFDVKEIREIIYDEDESCFYILTNKFQEKLGFFVLQFYENDCTRSRFLIKFKNKLDIGDCNITILKNKIKKTKEIVIGFKTININTYSVFVMDLSQEESN